VSGPIPFASARTILAEQVELVGGQARWAAKHGICRSVVCDILSGRKDPSEAVINALGYVVRPMLIPMKGQNHVG
jgi:hypothetical protein